ncbi:glycoside hydrolase family 71/99-like protein [Flexithrix dorotheae]|uniref:glycoside hydrolase family 71/99-like protein n=1 Tax=Flexithrix dorotheae TaxID=70993 RepID=UPI0003785963|nr:glycoside hydrolase family 71/99-like protein [Flexithrix dorotheae]
MKVIETKRIKGLITLILAFFSITLLAEFSWIHHDKIPKKHTISPGLVMAGYQGWFNTPDDGEDRGWHHYERKGRFEPGYCTIDLWPEMKEYEKQYETAFKFEDGSPATVFSPADESTVRLHFKWMEDYGIDGVFMQRFISEIRHESGRKHFTGVLESASKAALEYNRTIAVMYDLSGITSSEVDIVIEDWKSLLKKFGFEKRSKYSNYLFNEGHPVVSIWGVGFNDGRKYNLKDIEKLIRFFKSDEGGNCDVLLGVPTYWREQGRDCIKDENFLDVVKMADIVHPWFVGRFNEATYPNFKSIIGEDVKWCKQNGMAYIPVVFPGFSWNNMLPPGRPSSTIPRNKGSFFWKQLSGAASEGAEMMYVAMFDEIDEGTAIFKTAHQVPVGESKFIPADKEIPSDHYLWLTGKAADMLKRKMKLPAEKPIQK